MNEDYLRLRKALPRVMDEEGSLLENQVNVEAILKQMCQQEGVDYKSRAREKFFIHVMQWRWKMIDLLGKIPTLAYEYVRANPTPDEKTICDLAEDYATDNFVMFPGEIYEYELSDMDYSRLIHTYIANFVIEYHLHLEKDTPEYGTIRQMAVRWDIDLDKESWLEFGRK